MSTHVEALSIAVQTGIPVLLWGAPGTGKTSTIKALGEALDLPVETVIASIREPTDFAGLPVVRPTGVTFEPPRWAKRLTEAEKGILFLDEISTAPPAVQAALLRVVLDRVVGDLQLPAAVRVVAAANPPEQAAGGWELSMPLANRFCHIDWKLELDDWVSGSLTGWAPPSLRRLPDDWKQLIPVKRALVASFVKTRPELFIRIPENEAEQGRAWPSPRTWTMAADALAAAASISAPLDVESALVCGIVGAGPGAEYLHWVKNMDLPDPEDVLAAPEKTQIPSQGDKKFALLSGVTSAVLNNMTPERWQSVWVLISRFIKAKNADVTFIFAKTLVAAAQKRSDRKNFRVPMEIGAELFPIFKAAGVEAGAGR